uniref:uncharacterized protein LOC117611077 isoform X5 n=1 Tax=Osmia lignaria TaxID=473952 RepID=UPI0014796C3E|nr:uncharacterized protein LOC117611077 isoform X5 [Osmia lignaria]
MGYVHDEHIEKPIRITRLLHSSINADNYWPCISFDIKMNIPPGSTTYVGTRVRGVPRTVLISFGRLVKQEAKLS